jgi:hypothetical protein
MDGFLASLFLICVVPFALAMFEVWIKKSCRANPGESTAAGIPSRGRRETTVTRTPASRLMVYPKGLTNRWSHAGCFSGPSEGASRYSELVLHEICLTAPSGATRTIRTVVLKSSFQQCQRLENWPWN